MDGRLRRNRTVYAINRYYSPDTGRFTTHDPLTEIDRPERLNQPQGLNLYPYVMGAPTRYTDPDGQKRRWALQNGEFVLQDEKFPLEEQGGGEWVNSDKEYALLGGAFWGLAGMINPFEKELNKAFTPTRALSPEELKALLGRDASSDEAADLVKVAARFEAWAKLKESGTAVPWVAVEAPDTTSVRRLSADEQGIQDALIYTVGSRVLFRSPWTMIPFILIDPPSVGDDVEPPTPREAAGNAIVNLGTAKAFDTVARPIVGAGVRRFLEAQRGPLTTLEIGATRGTTVVAATSEGSSAASRVEQELATHGDDISELGSILDETSPQIQSRLNESPTVVGMARDEFRLASQQISRGHAYSKHVIDRGEFPGISTQEEFAGHIEAVMNNPSASRSLSNGRSAYWDDASGTVVIRDPCSPDGGTAFKPTDGRAYFEGLH